MREGWRGRTSLSRLDALDLWLSSGLDRRQNLTMRIRMRRFTRLTNNGFRKKIENLGHAVALHSMHYNFVRRHQTLRVTPAMAADVTKRIWSVGI
jgi:hypothetical protein